MRSPPFAGRFPPARKRGGLRLNSEIDAPRVRLVGADGEALGIVSIAEAMAKADDARLDLVEISPGGDPPVCRLLDHGKYRYREQKKKADAKRRQKVVDVKEIKVRPRIGEHDLGFKLKTIGKFLGEGNRVKVSLRFRGRELSYIEQGEALLARVVKILKDACKVAQPPRMEGRQLIMILSPGPAAANKVAANKAVASRPDKSPLKTEEKAPDGAETESADKSASPSSSLLPVEPQPSAKPAPGGE